MKSKASSAASTPSLPQSGWRFGGRQLLCHHGLVPRLHVSTSDLNPGRRYYKCPYWKPGRSTGACIFFEWVDPELSPWYKDMINRLRTEKLALEHESNTLVAGSFRGDRSAASDLAGKYPDREEDEVACFANDRSASTDGSLRNIQAPARQQAASLTFYRTAFFCCLLCIGYLLWFNKAAA